MSVCENVLINEEHFNYLFSNYLFLYLFSDKYTPLNTDATV